MNGYLFRQCYKITTPIFFGYIAIGIPFGVMIVQAGYPWWMSLFMSIVMYSGAGQYIAAGLLGAGAGIAEIILTEFFVNIRHIVYGLSLIEKTKGIGAWKPLIVFTLTDETYAILSSTDVPKNVSRGPFLGLIGLLDYIYWCLGAVIGALACNLLAKYGLAQYLDGVDFALTSLFVVILSGQIKQSHDVFPPLIGAVTCVFTVVLSRLGYLASSNIIFAAIILSLNIIVLARAKAFYGKREGKLSLLLVLFTVLCLSLFALLLFLGSSSGDKKNMTTAVGKSSMIVAIVSSIISGCIVFLERLFPFALFAKKDPPPLIRFIARYIPSMIIAILVVYSLKSVNLAGFPYGLPYFAGIALTLLLNKISGNPMVTIFGSTAVFILLKYFLA